MSRKKENAVSEEAQDKFQAFLFEMDDVLEDFVSEAREEGCNLDFSVASSQTLERYLADRLRDELTEESKGLLVSRGARYLGEVLRKKMGGKWELCLGSPDYAYFGLPVIVGHVDVDVEFCPIQVVTNFVATGRAGLLHRAIQSHLELEGK